MAHSVFLECPHRLPHFASCSIDHLVCADDILPSEHEYGHGAGCQERNGAGSGHVSFTWGHQPAVGVQKRNDIQQVERVSIAQFQ